MLWAALADPTRRAILDLLREGPRTVGQLTERFPTSRFAIRKHLNALEAARLVVVRWQGRERWNYLNAAPIQSVYERWVTPYRQLWAKKTASPNAMTITIRPAALGDAPALSRLGATTFRETFEAENTPEDMARYLAEAFTPERQAAEIADPAATVLLAEQSDESGHHELVGYAQVVSGPVPEAVRGPAPVELKRLYVLRAWHGRRVAQALMDAAIEAARARGAQTIWLGVWERNPRAAAFYAKYGFARVGEHTFVLGADRQTDWLLTRPVAASSE